MADDCAHGKNHQECDNCQCSPPYASSKGGSDIEADAAVRDIVFRNGEDIRQISEPKYDLPHIDAKVAFLENSAYIKMIPKILLLLYVDV